jgi:lantibiotic modifying enzyme
MAMLSERARQNGAYTTVNRGVSRTFSPNLLHGNAGIGYEMLRLASPDTIQSLL